MLIPFISDYTGALIYVDASSITYIYANTAKPGTCCLSMVYAAVEEWWWEAT